VRGAMHAGPDPLLSPATRSSSHLGSRPLKPHRVIVIGGGAAGFFAAIRCAESNPDADVRILEKGSRFLDKVRISGGGRCNVTHDCFDARDFTTRYPRGRNALIGPFTRFQARDTVEWFEARGVALKTERDGRMFPTTDTSQTIMDCLLHSARQAGVQLCLHRGVKRVERGSSGEFAVHLETGDLLECDKVLLATGGCRAGGAGHLATALGHTLEPPAPSLFTFRIELDWLRSLSGISVPDASIEVLDTKLRERGPLLVTHWGLSGPAVLKLSAWGARALQERHYQFEIRVHWMPGSTPESLAQAVEGQRREAGTRLIAKTPLPPLPLRLWEQLAREAGVGPETRWSGLSRSVRQTLLAQIAGTRFKVTGKSMNKEEFVTCGGVRLKEVEFKTMESRICPGLYFAGELLDIDGITGGFNFQAAWTTGWIAGQAMSGGSPTNR